MISYHFSSKQALLGEVIAPGLTELRQLLDDLAAIPATAAQAEAARGLVDIATRHRAVVVMLAEVYSTPGENSALAELIDCGHRVVELLAGSAEPDAIALAEFAVAGLQALCMHPGYLDDSALQSILTTAMSRLLRPATDS